VWSTERTALWIEARAPHLQYALVTAIDPRAAHVRDELARIAATVDIRGMLIRSGARALLRSGAAAGAAVVLLVAVPAGRPSDLAFRRTRAASAPAAPNRLSKLAAHVTPPSYAHQPARDVHDPAVISALVGSVIDISGHGPGAGLLATLGDDSVDVTPAAGTSAAQWDLRVTMPAHSRLMRLRDRDYERLVEFDAVADSPPSVVLGRPARDSTLRAARGVLRIDAQATDDIGLRDGYFELIVSAGNEEGSYRSVERKVGMASFADARQGAMAATIDLASIGLMAGGRLSVRAVARDDNALSGPGIGTSETRTIRIAAPGEYDSLAVEAGVPPPVDSAEVTQRMIVERTRALARAAGRLTRDTLLRHAERLSRQEDQLSERVQSLLNGQDEDEGGGPLVLPDWQRPLFDTALRALGDAAAELHTARLGSALVPELVALRVLDRARAGNRLYLRGGAPTVVVNTARVRLTGQDKPDAGPRTAEPPTDTAALAAIGRLDAVAQLARKAPQAAADSIAVLRIALTGAWPSAAAALEDAASALRASRDPAGSLARARRVIAGAPSVVQGLSAWDGGGE